MGENADSVAIAPVPEAMDAQEAPQQQQEQAAEENAAPSQPAAPANETVAGPAPPDVFVAMPLLQQAGEVFVGPGANKEAQLIGLGLTKLSSRRKDDLHLAKRYAMDISIKQIMLRQQKAHQENQQKQAMYAQALSLMARVYIGSISFEIREENVKKAFEVYGPIKTINMSFDPTTGHHKGFAFLEFDVPEAALLAQESMNGQLMGGRNLKVGRPSNMPQAQPIIEMVQQDSKKYHRVYVSSVHPDLSESDLKSVFEAFGEVVKCQLARQSATGKGTHRGFGYIEFNNANAMNEAISGMNMFDLGGQFLRVGRCITPPEALQYLSPSTQVAIPAAAAVAAAAVTARVMAAEATGSPSSNKGSSPAQGSPRGQSPAPKQQTPPPAVVHSPSPPVVPPPQPAPAVPTQVPPTFAAPPPPWGQPPAPVATAAPPVQPPPPMGAPVGAIPPPGMAPPGFAPPPVGTIPPPAMAPPPMGVAPPMAPIPPPPQPTTVPVATPSSIPVPPPVVSAATAQPAQPAPSSRRGFGGFSSDVPPPSAIPPPSIVPTPSTGNNGTGTNRGQGQERSFSDKLGRILDRTKAKQEAKLAGPVTFGAADPLFAPKDALETKEQEEQTQLSITGDVQSMALSIIGDGALVAAGKLKQHDQSGSSNEPQRKKKKPYEPKKIQPKLNSAQALAAAAKAGALSDNVINDQMNSEDATLASQEGLLNIRGNDARHLLMAKLMRTNRSCVLVLRNMVGPEDIDEYLEGEIKEECTKYGKPQEVVIANDESAGVVKIFVRFADPKEVDAAKAGLDNRFFGGRTVKAEVYDQAMFDHNDLSG